MALTLSVHQGCFDTPWVIFICLNILKVGIFNWNFQYSSKFSLASNGTLFLGNGLKLYWPSVISETLQFRAIGVTLTPHFSKRQKHVIFLTVHRGCLSIPYIDTKYPPKCHFCCYNLTYRYWASNRTIMTSSKTAKCTTTTAAPTSPASPPLPPPYPSPHPPALSPSPPAPSPFAHAAAAATATTTTTVAAVPPAPHSTAPSPPGLPLVPIMHHRLFCSYYSSWSCHLATPPPALLSSFLLQEVFCSIRAINE